MNGGWPWGQQTVGEVTDEPQGRWAGARDAGMEEGQFIGEAEMRT